jgi:hypothetical protein
MGVDLMASIIGRVFSLEHNNGDPSRFSLEHGYGGPAGLSLYPDLSATCCPCDIKKPLIFHLLAKICMSTPHPPFVHDKSLYALKPSMVWEQFPPKFILNQLVDLVKSGNSCSHGFKESQMKKDVNDVLDSTSISVSTSAVQPHQESRGPCGP